MQENERKERYECERGRKMVGRKRMRKSSWGRGENDSRGERDNRSRGAAPPSGEV